MIVQLINELYRGEQASIPVGGSPEQAARRLRETTRRWRGLTFMDTVVGSVAPDRVVLHLSHRSSRNAFAPVFRGRFAALRGRTYLTGRFALRRTVQAFMTVWFCFIAAFCLIAVVAVAAPTRKRGGASLPGAYAAPVPALPRAPAGPSRSDARSLRICG